LVLFIHGFDYEAGAIVPAFFIMWRKYFKIVNLKPCEIVVAGLKIDLRSDNVSLIHLKYAINKGCPFLELTPEGEKFFAKNDLRIPDKICNCQ